MVCRALITIYGECAQDLNTVMLLSDKTVYAVTGMLDNGFWSKKEG